MIPRTSSVFTRSGKRDLNPASGENKSNENRCEHFNDAKRQAPGRTVRDEPLREEEQPYGLMRATSAHCLELGPLRILNAWLPLPTWDKNDRIGVTRQGRRYLAPAARDYRAIVIATVRPVLPRRPWFDEKREWFVSWVQYLAGSRADDDHFLAGVRDDLREAGLVKDDARARTSRLVTRDDGPAGIWVSASQEGY